MTAAAWFVAAGVAGMFGAVLLRLWRILDGLAVTLAGLDRAVDRFVDIVKDSDTSQLG